MQIEKIKIEEHNQELLKAHQRKFDFIAADVKMDELLQSLSISRWLFQAGRSVQAEHALPVSAVAANHATSKRRLKILVCCMH